MSLVQESAGYFDFHHTANDTFDKIQPADLNQAAAVLATAVYWLADRPEPLPRIPPPEPKTGGR